MHDLLQTGSFPAAVQAPIDAEFRCHSLVRLESTTPHAPEADPRLPAPDKGSRPRTSAAPPVKAA